MKKVSVITLQNIKNYGSMLQAYATQELLRDKGFEAEIVDYTRPIAKFWNHILGYSTKDNILVRMVKTVLLFPTELRYALLWKSFKKTHLNSSAISYTTNEELKANPPQADIYCSGSDQVWNSGWNGGLLREFFLDYVPVGKPKYALASSVGMNEFNDAEKQELRSLLQEFSSISVRETSAVDMIKGLGIDNVYAVMDPTLTKDAAFWRKLATAPKHKKPYILIYQLGKDHRVDEYAKFMASSEPTASVSAEENGASDAVASAVDALLEADPISNQFEITAMNIEYDFGLKADDVTSYKGIKSNDNGDAGLVLAIQPAAGKAQDVIYHL